MGGIKLRLENNKLLIYYRKKIEWELGVLRRYLMEFVWPLYIK